MNPDHYRFAKEKTAEEFNRWRAANGPARLDFVQADFHNCDLAGKDLSNSDFASANLTGANLRGAILSGSRLFHAELVGADLTKANCENADFSAANLQGTILARTNLQVAKFQPKSGCRPERVDHCEFQRATLDHAELTGWIFDHCWFDGASCGSANFSTAKLDQCSFEGTSLQGTKFQDANLVASNFTRANCVGTDFSKADIGECNFFEAYLQHPQMRELSRVEDALNLETTVIQSEPGFHPVWFETAKLTWFNRYCDWERLATLGRLQLFGVSYTLLIYLVTSFYVIGLYNEKVDVARHWADQQKTEGNPAERAVAKRVTDKIKPLAISWRTFALLVSTMTLVAASILFAVACPAEVKDFTKAQWLYAHQRPLIHYWPLCWRWPRTRAICLFLYVAGGVSFLVLSVWKIAEAAAYGWQYLG